MLPEKNHAPEDPCVPAPDDSDTHAVCTADCTGVAPVQFNLDDNRFVTRIASRQR